MRNTKKWLVLLLTVMMLVNMMGVSAMAVENESPLGMTVSPASEGTVQVSILAVKSQIVADGKLVVTYDPAALTYVGTEPGDAWSAPDQVALSVNPKEGKIILVFASAEAANEDVLFNLRFTGDGIVAVDGSESSITGVDADLSMAIDLCPSAQFVDLDSLVSNYPEYHTAFDYIIGSGYMNGVSATHFAPGMELNRAMMVTILYRIAGEPAVEGAPAFTDVPAGVYCSDAVVWASETGITKGISDKLFAPTRSLTRMELVTFLYRFAEVMGYDRTATADLSKYVDANEIMDFALEGFSWAVAEGIVNGTTETTLAPKATTTRGQICLMVYRLLSAQD